MAPDTSSDQHADYVRCKRDGCRLPVAAKGLCSTHYQQLRLALKRKQGIGGWASDDGSKDLSVRVRLVLDHQRRIPIHTFDPCPHGRVTDCRKCTQFDGEACDG